MKVINKVRYFFHNPCFVLLGILYHLAPVIPDALYLKCLFRLSTGKTLHLKNPQGFNEKLQWLKLYNRRPEYSQMVDKYAVKDYVAEKIGREYIIPTLGVWENFDKIDFDSLPDKFVLKTTHGGGGGGVVICRNKDTFDKADAREKLNRSMADDCFTKTREWPYKKVPHRIIAEQLIEFASDSDGDLPDYKFFCFDGEVKVLFVATDRQSGDVKFDFFDADFNHLDIVQSHPMSGRDIPKPKNFEKMKELASKLSQGLPHARIDLYDTGDRVYFGEITFFHHGGITPFHPEEWDLTFGSWLKLPPKAV